MPEITTKAGPWGMTVYVYPEDDAANPLKNLSVDEVSRLPFGALELSEAGVVITHVDTEPGEGAIQKPSPEGKNFFREICPWAANSVLEREFTRGKEEKNMNVVFDCGVPSLHYKLRLHLKISPILSTYWLFVKRLNR